MLLFWLLVILLGVALIVWGAENFAEHLGAAAVRLRVSLFALSLLLAGAEPEELATAVAATLKDVPAIAFGDVIGANVAICLVAMGVGALVRPLPMGTRVQRYGLLGVPLGAIATAILWDGRVGRWEGGLLVVLYILYVALIWRVERQPPALGEVEELEEAAEKLEAETTRGIRHWVGRDLLLVLAGLAGMVVGSTLLVEAVRQISGVEEVQTRLGLTLVGFATAFELVALAWSAARRRTAETAIAGVVGSFAYNVTMTLGVAAIVRPLRVTDATQLHLPALMMVGALMMVMLLGLNGSLGRTAGGMLLVLYGIFVWMTLSL